MTTEELLGRLYDETLVGNAPAVRDGVNEGLEQDLAPERMLYDALIPSLEAIPHWAQQAARRICAS